MAKKIVIDPNKHDFEASYLRNIKSEEEQAEETRQKTVKTILITKGAETIRVNADGSTEAPHSEATDKDGRWDWAADGWKKSEPVKVPKAGGVA